MAPGDWYSSNILGQQQYQPIYSGASGYSGAATQQPIGRKKSMLDSVKNYVEKHKDMLFTIVLVVLIDHFLFGGALRSKIQTTLEGVLKKAEDKFHGTEVVA
jgi:hypothetical protein